MNKFNKIISLSLILLSLILVSGCSSSDEVENDVTTPVVDNANNNVVEDTTIEDAIADEVIGSAEEDVEIGDLI